MWENVHELYYMSVQTMKWKKFFISLSFLNITWGKIVFHWKKCTLLFRNTLQGGWYRTTSRNISKPYSLFQWCFPFLSSHPVCFTCAPTKCSFPLHIPCRTTSHTYIYGCNKEWVLFSTFYFYVFFFVLLFKTSKEASAITRKSHQKRFQVYLMNLRQWEEYGENE